MQYVSVDYFGQTGAAAVLASELIFAPASLRAVLDSETLGYPRRRAWVGLQWRGAQPTTWNIRYVVPASPSQQWAKSKAEIG